MNFRLVFSVNLKYVLFLEFDFLVVLNKICSYFSIKSNIFFNQIKRNEINCKPFNINAVTIKVSNIMFA